MMNEVNRKYLEISHFEEARAIFMMLTRMIDVKANFKNKYRNLECEICRVEENTQHLFKCKKYHGLNENIKGETLSEVLQKNSIQDIASLLKEIISRQEAGRKEEKSKKNLTNTAPLPSGLSLPDGRE